MLKIEKNFFIVDSTNLDEITSKLYGYTLVDNEILINKSLNDENTLSKIGSYVNIDVSENEIIISQDINGSYGIYIYQNEDYFAISNSFLYLVNFLKDKYPLTFNEDYALSFLGCDLCSFSYNETMINEIESLPLLYDIIIDKNNKKFVNKKSNDETFSIPLDSKEGIDLLDKWYNQWTEFIRKLKGETNNIIVDLNGGFDSRIVFGLMISSNINFDEIYIKSHMDQLHTHVEDYEIASEICSKYDIDIEKKIDIPKKYYDNLKKSLYISFYPKLSFHKQPYFKTYESLETTFLFTGFGGENIRTYWNHSPQEHEKVLKEHGSRYSYSLNSPIERLLKSSINEIKKDYSITSSDSPEITKLLYTTVRSPTHFGKSSVESFLINEIVISPLLDPSLLKLKISVDECESTDVLYATIFNRYFPELLDFKFDNNRTLDENAIEYSKIINNKYPFEKNNLETVSNNNYNIEVKKIQERIKANFNREVTSENETCYSFDKESSIVNEDKINEYIKNLVTSKKFGNYFKMYFPKDYYYNMIKNIESWSYFPLQTAIAAISAVFFKHLTLYNQECLSECDWLDTFIQENNYPKITNVNMMNLLKYNTCRIDIKNRGSVENDFRILFCSDESTIIKKPNWYNNDNEGVGNIIYNNNNELLLQFECIHMGMLEIILRSTDFKDVNGKAVPIYIDYEKFIVDDEIIFDNGKVISHDKNVKFFKEVKNHQIVKVYVSWKPLNKFSSLEIG